jgi:hypothetical protein
MTLRERGDGTLYPDSEGEAAILGDTLAPGPARRGVADWALGDLIVMALVGRHLITDTDEAPQYWETFEAGILSRTALDLRALSVALEHGVNDNDNRADDVINDYEVCAMVRAIGERAEAGAELARRLRAARWGHPAFGGGEQWGAEARAKRQAFQDEHPMNGKAEGSEVRP